MMGISFDLKGFPTLIDKRLGSLMTGRQKELIGAEHSVFGNGIGVPTLAKGEDNRHILIGLQGESRYF